MRELYPNQTKLDQTKFKPNQTQFFKGFEMSQRSAHFMDPCLFICYFKNVLFQASSVHEGNYSCSVPDYISKPVRIHIIEGIFENLTIQK